MFIKVRIIDVAALNLNNSHKLTSLNVFGINVFKILR